MLILSQPHQPHAQQRLRRKIKRPSRFMRSQLPQAIDTAQLLTRQTKRLKRRNDLDRFTFVIFEVGTQALMPPHDFIQTLLEHAHIKLSAQTQRSRNVVKRTVGFELTKKPESLLRERKRQLRIAQHRHERHTLSLKITTRCFFDPRRET